MIIEIMMSPSLPKASTPAVPQSPVGLDEAAQLNAGSPPLMVWALQLITTQLGVGSGSVHAMAPQAAAAAPPPSAQTHVSVVTVGSDAT